MFFFIEFTYSTKMFKKIFTLCCNAITLKGKMLKIDTISQHYKLCNKYVSSDKLLIFEYYCVIYIHAHLLQATSITFTIQYTIYYNIYLTIKT